MKMVSFALNLLNRISKNILMFFVACVLANLTKGGGSRGDVAMVNNPQSADEKCN